VTTGPDAFQVRELFAAFRRIDNDTNFFEAGLTSQALAQVLERLHGLGLELALVDLYRFPTVRALLSELARRGAFDGGGGSASRTELPWASPGM
jgi:aryl carrier-like protein